MLCQAAAVAFRFYFVEPLVLKLVDSRTVSDPYNIDMTAQQAFDKLRAAGVTGMDEDSVQPGVLPDGKHGDPNRKLKVFLIETQDPVGGCEYLFSEQDVFWEHEMYF